MKAYLTDLLAMTVIAFIALGALFLAAALQTI
jgi:hypothetical protein